MSEREQPDEPDLDALADRLEQGMRRRDVPVPAYDVRAAGRPAVVVRAVVAAVVLGALLVALGTPLTRVWWLALPVAVSLVVQLGIRPHRVAAHVDDAGITVTAGPRSGRGHHPWASLSEVGWMPAPSGSASVLALRPRRSLPGGGGPTEPLVVPVPVHDDAGRAEVRDVLAHACERHDVTLTEHEGALGTAPPGSRFRD